MRFEPMRTTSSRYRGRVLFAALTIALVAPGVVRAMPSDVKRPAIAHSHLETPDPGGSEHTDAPSMTSSLPAPGDSYTRRNGSSVATPSMRPCSVTGTNAGKAIQILYLYGQGRTNRVGDFSYSLAQKFAWSDFFIDDSASNWDQHQKLYCHTNVSSGTMGAYLTAAVTPVQVPLGAVDGTESVSINLALDSLGFNRTDRMYLVFVDGTSRAYASCLKRTGLDSCSGDHTVGPRYAVQSTNHAASTVQHEIGHVLGALPCGSPHSLEPCGTFTFPVAHSTEKQDQLAYGDINNCSTAETWKFDCNQDDYWKPGSLSTSFGRDLWNVARSPFLTAVTPE